MNFKKCPYFTYIFYSLFSFSIFFQFYIFIFFISFHWRSIKQTSDRGWTNLHCGSKSIFNGDQNWPPLEVDEEDEKKNGKFYFCPLSLGNFRDFSGILETFQVFWRRFMYFQDFLGNFQDFLCIYETFQVFLRLFR